MNTAPSLSLPSTVVSSDRVTVTTALPFDALVQAFERELGRWKLTEAQETIEDGWDKLEECINGMAGPHGLMILSTTNQGEVASVAGRALRCTMYEVGNPVVATKILRIDVRGCLLVPFKVALYEEDPCPYGQISFDRPSSLLRQLNRPALNDIGSDLDRKMETIVAILRDTATL